jgi:hypothetical protein
MWPLGFWVLRYTHLYLHSSIVQTRDFEKSAEGKRSAIKFATIDSTISLGFFFYQRCYSDCIGRLFILLATNKWQIYMMPITLTLYWV